MSAFWRQHRMAFGVAILLSLTVGALMLTRTHAAINAIDYYSYTLMAHVYSMQFHAGDFYPHWLSYAHGGLGSPIGIIFPNIGNLLVAILRFLPFEDSYSTHYYNAACLMALCGVLLAMYRWMRSCVAMFVLAAMPPLWWTMSWTSSLYALFAFMAIVGLLHAVERATRTNHFHVLPITGWMTLLALSHPPSLICFLPAFLVYAWVITKPEARTYFLRWIAASLGLAALLSAFYWVPLFAITPYINADAYTQWTSINTAHVLGIATTPLDWRDAMFGLCVFLAGGMTAGVQAQQRTLTREIKALWACLLVLIFFASPFGQAMLETLGVWGKIQHRCRFYYVGMLPLAGICAASLYARPSTIRAWWMAALAAIALLNPIVILYYSDAYNDSPPLRKAREQNVFVSTSLMATDQLRTIWQATPSPSEITPPESLVALWSLTPVSVINGEATIAGEEGIGAKTPGRAREFSVDVQSAYATLRLREFYFPYVFLHDSEEDEIYATAPEDETGLIIVEIPKGSHHLRLIRETPGQVGGMGLTILGVMICMRIFFRRSKK